MEASRRLEIIKGHLTKHVPKHTWFKQQGWGFNDTKFKVNERGKVEITGNRYLFSGKELPHFRKFAEEVAGVDLGTESKAQERVPVAPVKRHPEFFERVKQFCVYFTEDDAERLMHSHGHTVEEIYKLRYSTLERCVDLVVWPGSNEHVEGIVRLANELNVVLLPYGGGTNVTNALMILNEDRTVCSVDMTKMNHVREVRHSTMTAVVEAGISGRDLEAELATYGLCCGHEPDSSEFSTLGGWISTRASGMKKNRYGNIEDIVQAVTIVTPTVYTI